MGTRGVHVDTEGAFAFDDQWSVDGSAETLVAVPCDSKLLSLIVSLPQASLTNKSCS